MSNDLLIYALIDPRTRLIRYVGSSRCGGARPKQHRWPSSMAKGTHVACWVRSLHGLGLTYDITTLDVADNVDDLYAKECWWIAYGRALGWDLTNLTAGGEGPQGWVPTAETRARISAALKGKKASAETRAKMSQSHIGLRLTDESKKKLSLAKLGRPRPNRGLYNGGLPRKPRRIQVHKEP